MRCASASPSKQCSYSRSGFCRWRAASIPVSTYRFRTLNTVMAETSKASQILLYGQLHPSSLQSDFNLYHNWFQQIRELRPGQRITQIRNFVWLMIGIYRSRSVSLSRIAGKIPGKAQLLSSARRLSRFLGNPAIDVRAWYPIARSWLERQAQSLQQVRLIVDGTKVGFGHQLPGVG